MALTTGQQDSVRCSAAALDAGEPLAATAPLARSWLILEQPGPWGAKALRSSHLDPAVGSALADAADATGTTVLLARCPGRHADTGSPRPRRFWVAHTAPGGVRMRTGTVDDPKRLLSWDLAAVAAGALPPVGVADATPTLFICTNARRDLCCTMAGRPLAAALATVEAYRDRVWECSHLGGHRFAATALLLPWGQVHGRLDAATAARVLDDAAARTAPLATYRGRTALPRPLQAAEIAVRRTEGVTGIDDLDVLRVVADRAVPSGPSGSSREGADGPWVDCEVRHRDGRAWRVRAHRAEGPARAESCGGDPVVPVGWVADPPTPVNGWR